MSARAEFWVMSLAQLNLICLGLFCEKERAVEVVGKQVAPNNASICVNVFLYLWRANCFGLLGVVTPE